MSEQNSTPPDWNAARILAKNSIAMAELIIKAVNASSRKLKARRHGDKSRRQKKTNR